MDVFEETLKKVMLTPPTEDPFSHFNLRTFQAVCEEELTRFFVNYKSEMTKLLTPILSLSRDKEKQTVRVAVIGPSGSGKSTLLQYLLLKIDAYRRLEGYEKEFSGLNVLRGFFAKMATTGVLQQYLESIKRERGGVMIIDDMHEIFIKEDSEIIKKYLAMLSNETKNNVIITTWLPYGWSYATSKHPELKNLFDEVIFVRGLEKQHCRELLEKRFRHCSKKNEFNTESPVVFDPFTSVAIDKIIDIGCPNPNIMLEIIQESVKYAYENKFTTISDKEIIAILPKIGYGTYSEKLQTLSTLMRSIVQTCLAANSLSIAEICELLQMQRPNVSKYMNDLKDMGFFEKETIENESVFTMVPMLRYELERDIMKETEVLFTKK